MDKIKVKTIKSLNHTILFLSIAIGIFLISMVFFGLSFNKPYMGLSLSLTETGWIITSVDRNGSAVQAGISIGDIPVTINEQPANIFLEKYTYDKAVRGPLITSLTVIDTYNQPKSVNLQDSHPTRQTYIELVIYIVVCVLFWIIGFYVVFKKPQNITSRLLCLCSLFVGLVFSANAAGERLIPSAFWFSVIAFILGPWVLVHFFIVLPEERTSIRKNLAIYLIYLPAIITLIFYPLIGYANEQPVSWFRALRLIISGIGLLSAVGIAIFNYFISSNIKTRLQMKIVLIGCLLALIPFIILYIIPESVSKEAPSPSGFSFLFFVFIPLSMGYAVAAHKLLDIDFFIRRSVIYILIILVMVIILSVAIFISMKYPKSLSISEQILLAGGLGLIATLLFGPIKKGIELLVDKLFYKDRYDYRQIIEILSNSLKSLNDIYEISRVTVGTITKTLNLAGACLFMKINDVLDVSATQGIFSDKNYQNQLKNNILQNRQSYFPNMATSLDPNISFLVPLTSEENEIGVLCLSTKVSMQRFSSDDIFLIQGIASITAIALHSAVLIHDVNIKNTFISVASHELRTPLTAIMGYAELLMRHETSLVNKKRLQYILDNGQRISNMANELLNVSRIQSDKVTLKLEYLKLSDILKEQVDMMKALTDKHKFVINIHPDLPDVIADYDKISQVIANLLNNAIKYSPNGGRIVISAQRDSFQGLVILSITDEGIGISPEDKKLLFTTFHRIQRPETQGIRGSGLGLFIAKEWIEAMGGKIWVESELNKGATFFVAMTTQRMSVKN